MKVWLAIITMALFASEAQARLISAHLPAPDDDALEAMHLPTGCKAEVVLRNRNLIEARITDPSCLPKGVKARNVPGTLIDFTVTPK